jgi:hypothetical protein
MSAAELGTYADDFCECGKLIWEGDEYAERCKECYETHQQNRAEAAYEDSLGECFRGGEAAAYEAEQMDKVQRELKR